MVHVELNAEYAEHTVANVIGGWVEAHPGEHVLEVQVVGDNPHVHQPPALTWPDSVSGDEDALQDLAAAISDHATTYKIELRDEEGNGVHGIARYAPHGGHRYIPEMEKPGVVTGGWVWSFMRAPRFSIFDMFFAGLVGTLIVRCFS